MQISENLKLISVIIGMVMPLVGMQIRNEVKIGYIEKQLEQSDRFDNKARDIHSALQYGACNKAGVISGLINRK